MKILGLDPGTAITGYQPQLFRPPFGDYNNQVIEQAAAAGYQSVQWSVETLV